MSKVFLNIGCGLLLIAVHAFIVASIAVSVSMLKVGIIAFSLSFLFLLLAEGTRSD